MSACLEKVGHFIGKTTKDVDICPTSLEEAIYQLFTSPELYMDLLCSGCYEARFKVSFNLCNSFMVTH